MFYNIQSFVTYINNDHGHAVFLGNNIIHRNHGQGEVSIRLENGQLRETPNVLYVPRLFFKLFFAKRLHKYWGEILIKHQQCILCNAFGQHIATFKIKVSLYKLGNNNKDKTFTSLLFML
jgi:hypothetical protein